MSIDRYLYVIGSQPRPRWRRPANACIICILIWIGRILLNKKIFRFDLFILLISFDCFYLSIYISFIIKYNSNTITRIWTIRRWLCCFSLSSIISILLLSIMCLLHLAISNYSSLLYKIILSHATKFEKCHTLPSKFGSKQRNRIDFHISCVLVLFRLVY